MVYSRSIVTRAAAANKAFALLLARESADLTDSGLLSVSAILLDAVATTIGLTWISDPFGTKGVANAFSYGVPYAERSLSLGSASGQGVVATDWTDQATTIAALSNGQVLPQPLINVASTAGFPPQGTITIVNGGGPQLVHYTSIQSATRFGGCTGGVGAMATGDAVTFDATEPTISTDLEWLEAVDLPATIGANVTWAWDPTNPLLLSGAVAIWNGGAGAGSRLRLTARWAEGVCPGPVRDFIPMLLNSAP